MTVNNGFEITEDDVIEHLKFVKSNQEVLGVYTAFGELYIGDGSTIWNEVTLENNVITFGNNGDSAVLNSYTWE